MLIDGELKKDRLHALFFTAGLQDTDSRIGMDEFGIDGNQEGTIHILHRLFVFLIFYHTTNFADHKAITWDLALSALGKGRSTPKSGEIADIFLYNEQIILEFIVRFLRYFAK